MIRACVTLFVSDNEFPLFRLSSPITFNCLVTAVVDISNEAEQSQRDCIIPTTCGFCLINSRQVETEETKRERERKTEREREGERKKMRGSKLCAKSSLRDRFNQGDAYI